MSKDNVSMDDVRAALSDPSVKKSSADKIIPNIMSSLNMGNLTPITEEDAREVLKTYFQAVVLETDGWTSLPNPVGHPQYVQIDAFKLKELPPNTSLVADVMIDESQYEKECFDKYVTNMEVRDRSIVFYASGALPIKVTIGLKCIDNTDGVTPVIPSDELYVKKR